MSPHRMGETSGALKTESKQGYCSKITKYRLSRKYNRAQYPPNSNGKYTALGHPLGSQVCSQRNT